MRGRNYSACSMLERMFTNSVRLVASLVVLQVSNADELAAERLAKQPLGSIGITER